MHRLTPTTLSVTDGQVFAVGRIICVGRNYAEHAKEMGDAVPEPPFFFLKPSSCLHTSPSLAYPPRTSDLHHEAELVAAIGRGGRDIPPENALAHVYGYAAGLDMTRRDLQSAAKDKRRPWDMGKIFDGAAPCGPITPAAQVPAIMDAHITLHVNGEIRQSGQCRDMIWDIASLIAELSTYIALAPGDLIYTGTPAGVGAVNVGDTMQLNITGLVPVTLEIM